MIVSLITGHTTDSLSMDYNQLIRDNKAALIQSADDFMLAMGWTTEGDPPNMKAFNAVSFLN